jgi:hypothetical protein
MVLKLERYLSSWTQIPLAFACLACVVFFLPSHTHAASRPPAFSLPLDCEIGTRCFVQNYVDQAPGEEVEDHTCGYLSYDGHKGTDIRVSDLAELKKGVTVIAAAAGRVTAIRDGVPDRDFRDASADQIRNIECGNGVIIDHGNGWQSKYCHMRRGSILAQKGRSVVAGQALGMMGLSGKTAFPHLHFEVVHNKKFIDPFTGLHQRKTSSCNVGQAGGSLWKPAVRTLLGYKSSGLIGSGFATAKPDIKMIEKGRFKKKQAPVKAPVLLYWIQMYGLQPGDKSEILVTRPDGKVLAQTSGIHSGTHKAQWYSFVGKRRPKVGRWPAGHYVGRYKLSRVSADGSWQEVFSVERKIELKP